MNNKYLSIGRLSNICSIPITTLRYYDKIGVLKPAYIDTETKYRYYDTDAVFLVVVLRYYQKLGFSLEHISILLERNDLPAIAEMLRQKSSDFDTEINILKMRQASLSAWADLVDEAQEVIKTKNDGIFLRWIEEESLLYVDPKLHPFMEFRHLLANADMGAMTAREKQISYGPLYAKFPFIENRLNNCYNNIRLYIRRHPLNHPTDMVDNIGGYQAITTYHCGSYEEIGKTYQKMIEWAKLHRFKLRGDTMERYVIDPWSTIHEQNYVTEIFLPIL